MKRGFKDLSKFMARCQKSCGERRSICFRLHLAEIPGQKIKPGIQLRAQYGLGSIREMKEREAVTIFPQLTEASSRVNRQNVSTCSQTNRLPR